MLKVKEYLDKYFYSDGTNTISGSGVSGAWEYPKGIKESERKRFDKNKKNDPHIKKWVAKDQISLYCNNETLQIGMVIIDGKSASIYGYLQTYQHIPRGEPDKNGYYARSTDEEVIRYIDGYFVRIKLRERNWKLKNIINKIKNE